MTKSPVSAAGGRPDIHYVDSDDELLGSPPISASYPLYLLEHVVHKTEPSPADVDQLIDISSLTFVRSLGLVLEDFAGRVAKSEEIIAAYNRIKQTKLALTDEEYGNAERAIVSFIDDCTESHSELFFDPAEVRILHPKKKISIFHYIFNPSITCEHISQSSEAGDPRILLAERLRAYRDEGKFEVAFLQKSYPHLAIAITPESETILAYSILVNRREKNILKGAVVKSVDCTTSVYLVTQSARHGDEIVASEAVSMLHAESRKIQSELPYIGTYEKIFAPLYGSGKKLNEVGKYVITGLKHFIKCKALPVEVSHETTKSVTWIEHKILDLAQLMFVVEPMRNKTAIITSPMFLDLLLFTSNNEMSEGLDVVEEYPMALAGAVDGARTIRNIYNSQLPGRMYMDYATGTSEEQMRELLLQEGQLLVKWLSRIGSTPPALVTRVNLCYLIEEITQLMDKTPTCIKYHEIKAQLETLRDSNKSDNLTDLLTVVCKELPVVAGAASSHSAGKRRKVESTDFELFKKVVTESNLIEKMEAAAQIDVEHDLQDSLHLCSELLEDWYGLDISEVTALLGSDHK